MDSASPIQGQRILLCRLCMFEEMKKPLGENLAVSTPTDCTRRLIKAVCHSSILVSYIFLEIQSNGGMNDQVD